MREDLQTDAVRVSASANNLPNTYPGIVQAGNRGGANPFTIGFDADGCQSGTVISVITYVRT